MPFRISCPFSGRLMNWFGSRNCRLIYRRMCRLDMNRCLYVNMVILNSLRFRARSRVILKRKVVVNRSMKRLRLTRSAYVFLRIPISVPVTRVRWSMSTYVVIVWILSNILSGVIVGFVRFVNRSVLLTVMIFALGLRFASLTVLVTPLLGPAILNATLTWLVIPIRCRLKKVCRRVVLIANTIRNRVRCRLLVCLISLMLMDRLSRLSYRHMRLDVGEMVN